jgi:hypothetical protein
MSYGRLNDPLKGFKDFKCFNTLKISLKTLLKKLKDSFFKDRYFKFLSLKSKTLLVSKEY